MQKRKFDSRDRDLWKDLYVSLVRTYLEYDVQAWNSHLQEETEKMKSLKKGNLNPDRN